MEPVAEFLEDVFIVCYAWRYALAGGCALLAAASALLPLWRRISQPRPQRVEDHSWAISPKRL
jgi:hypothetical protein